MPEASILISTAVVLVSTAPKSDSSYLATKRAMKDIDEKDIGDVQSHLRDGHYKSAKKLGVKGINILMIILILTLNRNV